MLKSVWPGRPAHLSIGFGVFGAGLYLAMTGITLAHLEAASGHAPFDMRPFGYGPREAAALLGALGDEGRAYYLTRQIPLDMVYPAILALTLILTITWVRRTVPGDWITRTGVILAISAAAFDYAENLGIAAMILSWPDLPDALIHTASTATVAKSAATSAAVSILVCAGACRAVARGRVV